MLVQSKTNGLGRMVLSFSQGARNYPDPRWDTWQPIFDGVREHDRRVQQEVGRRVQDQDDLSSGLRRML